MPNVMTAGILAAVLLEASAVAPAPPDRFTDPRDGYAYPVVSLGGLEWFAENLRFRSADSRCYENDEANCLDHGRLYRLPDALRACPAGWRVPSEEDWRSLERWLGLSEADLEKERGQGSRWGSGSRSGVIPGSTCGTRGGSIPTWRTAPEPWVGTPPTGRPPRRHRMTFPRRRGTATSRPTGTASGGRR